MVIKPTSAYKDMCIYYTTDPISLLIVSATFMTSFREVFFERHNAKNIKPMYRVRQKYLTIL
jgi:hypothetical protein